ncbi:hypothetical protein [Pseudooceanicola sp. LIPI14-2-Ac024]|uniref:hypothetical protein n=1 Tax=Pseudooceanicola sp. LIPI14-2-Ac024 TaxID=3344875 RepID=UPI0035CED9AD
MRRAATLVTLVSLVTASAAWAAYSTLPVDGLYSPTPGQSANEIVIYVPPQDLGRCIATLINVMQMPVDPAQVSAVRVDYPADAPTVRCQAE